MLALFSNSHIKVDRCIIASWHSRRWHLASPSERHPCRNRAPFDRCSFRCIHQITGRLYNFVLLGTKRGLTFSSNFLLHYFNKCIQSHKLRGVKYLTLEVIIEDKSVTIPLILLSWGFSLSMEKVKTINYPHGIP